MGNPVPEDVLGCRVPCKLPTHLFISTLVSLDFNSISYFRHNPGPEMPLPDREKQKRTVINPHGVRPALTQSCPVEDIKIPRFPGE